MADNFSSPLNSSTDLTYTLCTPVTINILTSSYNFTRLSLLIPFSIIILYLGFKQWEKRRTFQTMSHSDIFTYHLAVLELIWSLGRVLACGGSYFKLSNMVTVGNFLSGIFICGEIRFHILTCVERYLAVVHPVTYHGLRNVRGIKIRGIGLGCAWLLCFVWSSVTIPQYPVVPSVLYYGFLVFSLTVISYCSLCVLCALIHPGPGDGGRDREQVDHSKQMAFFTIIIILGVLFLVLLVFIVTLAITQSTLLNQDVQCLVLLSGFWLQLPSSLVLPLLYLRRRGKPLCWHLNNRQTYK